MHIMVGVVILHVADCGKFAPGLSWLTISWYTLINCGTMIEGVKMATVTMIYHGEHRTYFTMINHGEKVPCTVIYHDKCGTMISHDKCVIVINHGVQCPMIYHDIAIYCGTTVPWYTT
jgi:hypothetical protein